jgi:hypothetical protein
LVISETRASNFGHVDFRLPSARRLFRLGGLKRETRSGLVDYVDGLVRQEAVVYVADGELDGARQGVLRVGGSVVLLVVGGDPFEDLDGVLRGRLGYVYLLEPAAEGAVLQDVVAVLLVGGRTYAADGAGVQGGLEDVRRVHGAGARGAGPHDGMDFIYEKNEGGVLLDLLDQVLQTLLEVAAVFGPGDQGAHVQGPDLYLAQLGRDLALCD